MLNNVRSRVTATGSVVVAGTLSRGQQADTRGRRIGGNEITDSFRQIFGPLASLSDENTLSESHSCTDIAMDNFVKSDNFKHMIEDVAKLSGVQEVIFKHIPVTMFEKDKAMIKASGDKLTIEKGAEEDDCQNHDGHAPKFDRMDWSMIDEETESPPLPPPPNKDTVSRKTFEDLKDDKEEQDELNNYLIYQNEQFSETIDMLCKLLQENGVDTTEIMERQRKKITSKPPTDEKANKSENVESRRVGESDETISDDDNCDGGMHITFQELMRGAVITAAVYVVILSIARRSPSMRQSTQPLAGSASKAIFSSFQFAFNHGKK